MYLDEMLEWRGYGDALRRGYGLRVLRRLEVVHGAEDHEDYVLEYPFRRNRREELLVDEEKDDRTCVDFLP
jgi:hypothetical protein